MLGRASVQAPQGLPILGLGVKPRAVGWIEIRRPLGPHPLADRRVKGGAARPPLPTLGEGERGGRLNRPRRASPAFSPLIVNRYSLFVRPWPRPPLRYYRFFPGKTVLCAWWAGFARPPRTQNSNYARGENVEAPPRRGPVRRRDTTKSFGRAIIGRWTNMATGKGMGLPFFPSQPVFGGCSPKPRTRPPRICGRDKGPWYDGDDISRISGLWSVCGGRGRGRPAKARIRPLKSNE